MLKGTATRRKKVGRKEEGFPVEMMKMDLSVLPATDICI